MDGPPSYKALFGEAPSTHTCPPPYTPSVQHVALCYCLDEGAQINSGRLTRFFPAIFEIDSTKLNLYKLDGKHGKYVAYLFRNLRPDLVEPQLNIKTVDVDYSEFAAAAAASDAPGSNSLSDVLATYTPAPRKDFLLNRLAKRATGQGANVLAPKDRNSEEFADCCRLVDFSRQINGSRYDAALSTEEVEIQQLKRFGTLYNSWSLQELVKYGNASDFANRPFTLRVVMASSQLLLSLYNAPTFVQSFFKLNVARELSLDLDMRSVLPYDYCVPRRRRHHRHRHRSRRGTNDSVALSSSSSSSSHRIGGAFRARLGSNVSTSTAVDDDEPDEADSTIEDIPGAVGSTASTSSTSEFRRTSRLSLLRNELAVESSSASSGGRYRSNSVFSTADTEDTEASEVLDDTLGELQEGVSKVFLGDNDEKDESVDDASSELVFAVKCIKNCINQTRPFAMQMTRMVSS